MNDEIQHIKQWLGSGSINIFGEPFAGKDTQGNKLSDLFSAPLIGGGEILRSHEEPGEIQDIIDSGGIIPSDFYLQIVTPYLSRDEFAGKPLLLSAVGRSHGEGPVILQACSDAGHPIKAVIFLKLGEEEVWKRFEASQAHGGRGDRQDDSKAALEMRLKKFQEKTMPVIDFYRQQGLLIEIDGALPIKHVTESILEKLNEQAT